MDHQGLIVTGKSCSKIYRENPFYEEPPPRGFYYPSKEKHLSRSERKTALSPERQGGASSEKQKSSPEQKFLARGHAIKPLESVQKHLPQSPPSTKFDESWPDSERPSSPSFLTGYDAGKPQHVPWMEGRRETQPTATTNLINSALTSTSRTHQPQAQGKGQLDKLPAASVGTEKQRTTSPTAEKGSVLQRYIERFRYGTPMSREERSRAEGSKKREFWWLESDPPTPNSTSTPKDEARTVSRTSHQRDAGLTVENLRRRDQLDVATDHLQEKTDRLLSSAKSIGSSEPIVSTEGLGSTTSDVSSFSEPVARPAFIPRPYTEERDRWTKLHRPAAKGSEEDILYKWRLQRKLEQARGGAVAPPPSAKPAPKTQAEQEVYSRLAAFREKLLFHPDVAASEVRQARVDRVMKETQTQMDSAVQTSPLPSWSYTRRVDTFAQAGGHDILESSEKKEEASAQPASKSDVKKTFVDADALHGIEQRLEGLHTSGAGTNAETSRQQEQKVSDGSESHAEPSSYHTSSQQSPRSAESKYRQFLTAEKPHVDDGGDTQLKKKSFKNVADCRADSDRSDKSDRKCHRSRADDDRLSASSASEKSERIGDTDNAEVGVALPGASGDAKACGDTRERSTKNKHSREERESETDSDASRKSSSRRQKREMKKSAGPSRKGESFEAIGVEHHGQSSARSQEDTEQHGGKERSDAESKKPPSKHDKAAEQRPSQRQYHEEAPTQQYQEASDSQARVQGSRGERPRGSGLMPPPQYSSSPARTSMSSAIGQVIHDRLFDVSTSVMSSVDSFSSSLYRSGQSPQRMGDDANAQGTSSESVYESDGEFDTDPLLQLLRQQRQDYEMKLRQLDALLAQRESQDDQ